MIANLAAIAMLFCAGWTVVIYARIHRRQREQLAAAKRVISSYYRNNQLLARALNGRVVEVRGDVPPDDAVIVLVVPSLERERE